MKGFHLVFKMEIDGLEDLGRDFLGLKERLCKWEKRVKMGKFAGIQRGKGGLFEHFLPQLESLFNWKQQ